MFLTLGTGLLGLDKPQRALNAYRAAIHIEPSSVEARIGLAQALSSLGEGARAAASLDKATEYSRGGPGQLAKIGAVYAQIDSCGLPARLSERWTPSGQSMVPREPNADVDDLRVGYLTDSARNVDEMRILESMLTGQDRESVISVVYSADVPSDPTPTRLGNLSAGWMNIRDHSDETVIQRMNTDKIDVLIDLTFDPDGQRPGILEARPAPLIVGVFGPKPGFLGTAHDRVLVHQECATGDDRELTIDVSPVSIDQKTMAPVGDTVPAVERGFVTYGASMDLRRLTPDVAATFAAVLRTVPNSRLMLGNRNLVPEAVRNRAVEYFADHGVIDRIDIEDSDHRDDETLVVRRLKFMVSVDVYLETFPVSGPLSAVDALWAGTTVVAMNGRPIDGGSTASVLQAAGLSEWIAEDPAAFVERASLAAEKCVEDGYREMLRNNVRETSVFDVKKSSRGIEAALRKALAD